jgi:hypothetical protein
VVAVIATDWGNDLKTNKVEGESLSKIIISS